MNPDLKNIFDSFNQNPDSFAKLEAHNRNLPSMSSSPFNQPPPQSGFWGRIARIGSDFNNTLKKIPGVSSVENAASSVAKSDVVQNPLKYLGYAVNQRYNPGQAVNTIVGAGKEAIKGTEQVAKGMGQSVLQLPQSVYNLGAEITGAVTKNPQLYKSAMDNQAKLYKDNAMWNALGAPKVNDAANAYLANPTKQNRDQLHAATVSYLGNAIDKGIDVATIVNLLDGGGELLQGAKAGVKAVADAVANQGVRKTLYSTAQESGRQTFADTAKAMAQARAKGGPVREFLAGAGGAAKQALNVGTGRAVLETPLGKAVTGGVIKPIQSTGIKAAAAGVAKVATGAATGNKQVSDSGKAILNYQANYPGSKVVNAVGPFLSAEGVTSDLAKGLTGEKALGRASHPVYDLFKGGIGKVGQKLSNDQMAQYAQSVDSEAIRQKLLGDPKLAAQYQTKDGALDIGKATQDLQPTLTKTERQNALSDILDRAGAGKNMTKAEQAQQFQNYIKAATVSRKIESRYGALPGTLTPIRDDTRTKQGLIAAANDLVKWHGGQIPDSVRKFLQVDAQTAPDRRALGKLITRSPVVSALVDKEGSPIMGGVRSNQWNKIQQAIIKASDTANRTIKLSAADQKAVEEAGYQGVGFTPFISKAAPAEAKTLSQKITEVGGAPKEQVSQLHGISQRLTPQYIEDKLATAPWKEVKGDRNLAGKLYDMLDRATGFNPVSSRLISAEFNRNLQQRLEKAFPAGFVTAKEGTPSEIAGKQLTVSKEDIGPWLNSTLRDVAEQNAKTIANLSNRDLRSVFSYEDANKIGKAIKNALPINWKTQGLEAVQNILRKDIPGFNTYFKTINTVKYSKNPAFQYFSYPLKTSLLMAANSIDPFYVASSTGAKEIKNFMTGMGEFESLAETAANKGRYWNQAAGIAEQVAKRGTFYGLSKNYDGITALTGNDKAKVQDIVERILHYANRSPLERSINTVLFPFSFEKKVYGQILGGLGRQSGMLPLLAVKGLNSLNNYMNGDNYKKFANNNPAEAYLIAHFNPFGSVAGQKFPGSAPLEVGGQYYGSLAALKSGLQAAFYGTTNSKGNFTPAPSEAVNKLTAFLNAAGPSAGIAGLATKSFVKGQTQQEYQDNATKTQLGEQQYVARGGSRLAWMQTERLRGNAYYDKFFKSNPTLDPYSSQFNGKLAGVNELSPSAIAAGALQAKSDKEKLVYMQNLKLAGVSYYDKFFSANPTLDPTSSQFKGFSFNNEIAKLVKDFVYEKTLRQTEVSYYKQKETNTYYNNKLRSILKQGNASIRVK